MASTRLGHLTRTTFAAMGVLVATLPFALGKGTFTVSSPAFGAGRPMPARFTCAAPGVSPPLSFGAPPAGTRSFAVLNWDDDAPGGLAAQWVVYDLPPTTTALLEGVPVGASVSSFKQGRNTAGRLGYTAPCPAVGGKPHRVYFDFYALNVPSLGLNPGASLETVHAAIKRHKLLEVKLLAYASR